MFPHCYCAMNMPYNGCNGYCGMNMTSSYGSGPGYGLGLPPFVASSVVPLCEVSCRKECIHKKKMKKLKMKCGVKCEFKCNLDCRCCSEKGSSTLRYQPDIGFLCATQRI